MDSSESGESAHPNLKPRQGLYAMLGQAEVSVDVGHQRFAEIDFISAHVAGGSRI
jgi:hypothetical protein